MEKLEQSGAIMFKRFKYIGTVLLSVGCFLVSSGTHALSMEVQQIPYDARLQDVLEYKE